MVAVQQISCVTRQKLGNLQSQTGNFVAQQSWARKLLILMLKFVACPCGQSDETRPSREAKQRVNIGL